MHSLRQLSDFYRRPVFVKFVRGHVRTVPGNMDVKFEIHRFNCLNWSDREVHCAQTHTDRHTSNENNISLIHSVHLAAWRR